jgi:hypothetical protein
MSPQSGADVVNIPVRGCLASLTVESGLVCIDGPDLRLWRLVEFAICGSLVLVGLGWLLLPEPRPGALWLLPSWGLVCAVGLAVRARLRVRVCFTTTATWVERGRGRQHLEPDVRVFASINSIEDAWADFGFRDDNRLQIGSSAETAELVIGHSVYGPTAEDFQAFATVANDAVAALRARQ